MTSTSSAFSRLLTVDQVAERLNVSVAYVRRRLIFEHRLDYVKIGRHVRIDEAELEAFIDAGRVSRSRRPPHPPGSDFGGRTKPTRRHTRG